VEDDGVDLRAELERRWESALPGWPELGAQLIGRYGEPSRHYHDLTHLVEVLTHIDTLADVGTPAADLRAVRLAAWFHDAIYDIRADDNEEQSARLAQTSLTEGGVATSVVAEVARLVRLTAAHDPSDDDDAGHVLCDADLAILASGPDRYEAYRKAVRTEYCWVPDDAFRSGRAAILRQLLALPRLFGTAYGRDHWEATARANVARELASLEG
jgi:predicted metal-dependent HD superfamily phosphohydrolase